MLHENFVGRETPLNKLNEILDSVLKKQCRVAFITGGPGIGKSQLSQEFALRTQSRHEKLLVATGNCNAHTGAVTPYLPFLDLLSQLTGNVETKLAEGGLTEQGARRLKEAMNVSIKALIENAPDLIGTFIPSGTLICKSVLHIAKKAGWLSKLEKQVQKEPVQLQEMDKDKLLDQYTELLCSLAVHYPMILILDDLQWADGSSIALFLRILEKLSNSPIMLLGTFRSVDISDRTKSSLTSWRSIFNEIKINFGDVWIDLEETSEEENRTFVFDYLKACPNKFPEQFSTELFQKTSGHPLFLAELLQGLVECGKIWRDGDGYWITSSEIDWTMLPSRVEGAIAERIAQVEDNLRELLAIASVEGVSFTVPVLAAICEQSEYSILKLLSRKLDKRYHLIREGSIREIAGNWLCQYIFSSAFFQQYLYGELSRRERMILHGRIAKTLEDLYKGQVELIAVELALHYDLAGEHALACRYFHLVGSRAIKVGAYSEALKHFHAALDKLDKLPDSDENDQLRIEIYIPYCNALRAVYGWHSAEVMDACTQAREFCRKVGAIPEIGPFLFNLWASCLVHLDLSKAKETAIENIRLGDEIDSNEIRIQGYIALGNTEYWLGHFANCIHHMNVAKELLQDEDIPDITSRYGQDMRLFVYMFQAFSHWMTGHFEQANQCIEEMMNITENLEHRFGLAVALQASSWHSFHQEDAGQTKAMANRLITLSREINLPFYEGIGLMFLGWAQSMLGEKNSSYLIDQGFVRLGGDRLNSLMYSIYVLCRCSAQKAEGKVREASSEIEKAIPIVRQSKCEAYLAELFRVAGEVLTESSDTEKAFSYYEEGLRVAQSQEATALEVRINRSLGKNAKQGQKVRGG